MSPAKGEKLIEVKGLEKHFKHVEVLRGINIDICKGDVMAVIGPSGGGKSTFLRSLNLLEKPTSGSIIFDGVDITGKKVDLPLHRQQGTEAEHQGLQGQAHALGPGANGGGFFAGQILLRQKGRVLRQPTPAQGVEHAHGLNGLGIAQMRAGLLGGLHR